MRVAVDTNSLFTGRAGVARYTRGLLEGLRHAAPEVEFIPFAWEVENLDYRQPMRACKTFYRELVWARTVAPRRLTSASVDVYHATGSCFVSVPSPIGRVVTLHDLAILRTPQRFRPWQRRAEAMRLASLKEVDRVICISRFTANEAMELLGLPASKLEVVYNGGSFQPQTRPVPEQLPDFKVPPAFFLFVGSLEPGKNLGLLKETYALATAQGKLLPPLLIVGARWPGVGTEGQPPAGWQYLGHLPDAVLVHLYRRATALVYPSKYEGFGLPVAEAMSLACPVICSPVASLPEVGGEAVLWSELTAAAYLRALLDISSNDRLRVDLIQAGLAQASLFTWERCARGVLEVYRHLAGQSA